MGCRTTTGLKSQETAQKNPIDDCSAVLTVSWIVKVRYLELGEVSACVAIGLWFLGAEIGGWIGERRKKVQGTSRFLNREPGRGVGGQILRRKGTIK